MKWFWASGWRRWAEFYCKQRARVVDTSSRCSCWRLSAKCSHGVPVQLLQEHGQRQPDGEQLPSIVQAQRNFERRVRAQVRALPVGVCAVALHAGRS